MLYFIHRIDRNVGDTLAGPYRYWQWEPHAVIDICDLEKIDRIEPGARIILGGGGLLMPAFSSYLTRILSRDPSKVVWWGIGERRIQNFTPGYLPRNEAGVGIAIGEFPTGHLVGLRSLEDAYEHVPCPSCKFIPMHQHNIPHSASIDVGIFEHRAVRIGRHLKCLRMVNTCCSPKQAIDFIASCKVLVTNSYHGLYWGCLLNKTVICV